MAVLNAELAQIARDVISEMRAESCAEDDIKFSARAAIIKHCEETGIITTDWPTKEDMAAIMALVIQVQKEDPPEVLLTPCPYCAQLHPAGTVEQCVLKPKQGNDTIASS
jgi:hypothetical protein